ncbi:MAG: tetratricopeptide repeat protein [Nitrospirae bacterium]|nr:tetratricopeptide repeat protein [Nitrospirota bacterium]
MIDKFPALIKKVGLAALVIYAAAGFLIYSNVLTDGIFIFDDFEYIVDNPTLKNMSFFSHMTDPRHIGYLSFGLNFALDGMDPYGFHLFNIIIHILNALLVFSFVRLTLKILRQGDGRLAKWDDLSSFTAGLIFLVHPIETQAVSYITQRFTSMTSLFYLSSVVSYLSARWRLERSDGPAVPYVLYGVSIVSCMLAMKTKEIAFTIPFMIGALEYLLFKGSALAGRRFIYLIPLFATLVIIPMSLFGPEYGLMDYGQGVDEVTRRDKIFDLQERSTFEYLITQFRVIVIYLRLLVLPVHQLAVYDLRASNSVLDLRVLTSLALLLAIAATGFYCWRKAAKAGPKDAPVYMITALGILWFYVTLSIESSIIPIKDLIFEHRAYLPSVGIIALFSVVSINMLGKFLAGERVFAKAAACILVVVIPLSVATYRRNFIWTDEVLFWGDIVEKTGKAIGYNNRGNAYLKNGQLDLALKDLTKTISFFPNATDEMAWENSDFTPMNMAKTYQSRANVFAAMGDTIRAQADFDTARAIMGLGMRRAPAGE